MNRLLGHTGIAGIGFTALLVGLIAVAAGPEIDAGFLMLQLAVMLGAVAIFLRTFPGSRFFAIAFANGLAVYSCLFLVFTQTNFAQISQTPMRIGFVLPLVAFLVGAMIRRERIRRIVLADNVPDAAEVARSFVWLAPVFSVGVVSFILPTLHLSETAAGLAFLAAMAAIAAIVFAVSADVSRFLIETGLLFEEFFGRIAQMVVPTFAFLTFYSIVVIVFATFYRIIDRLAAVPNFHVGGQARAITFPESLYFSVVTMATVGYGDIVPASDAARALAAIQVVLGVLLLLVGFSEIFTYTRERRRGRHEK